MSAFDERREQDIHKLRDLQEQSRERVRVISVSGRPANEIDVELRLKTAPSRQYPHTVQDVTSFTISLPARYPFVEPFVNIRTPILHPNVYSSGRICLGIKWLPSFGLDLLVRRIAQIVTFDTSVLNESSPANRDALEWYRRAKETHPHAFPTDSLLISAPEQRSAMKWENLTSIPTKSIVPCSRCQTKLSVPQGKKGMVRCPTCGNLFHAET